MATVKDTLLANKQYAPKNPYLMSAFCICTLDIDNTGKSTTWSATAFLYEHEGERFVVTNRHVMQDAREVSLKWLMFQEDTEFGYKVKPTTITVTLSGEPPFSWYEHPDFTSLCDIAVIPIPHLQEQSRRAIHKPVNMLGSTEFDLQIGSRVCVVGFPQGMDMLPGIPAMTEGSVMTLPGYAIENSSLQSKTGEIMRRNPSPAIWIDTNISSGMSGSPVFSIANEKAFVGIVNAQYTYFTKGHTANLIDEICQLKYRCGSEDIDAYWAKDDGFVRVQC